MAPTTPSDPERPPGPFRRAAKFFFQPSTELEAVDRRRSRILATFLLVAIAIFGFVDSVYVLTVPGYVPPWYGYVLLVGAWVLNFYRRYRGAAMVTLAMFPLVIFSMVVTGKAAEPRTTLSYLVLGILLASILLPWRGVALFTLVSLGGLALMPVLAPETVPSMLDVIGPFSVTALGAGLCLVFMYHRDQVERDRQAELRASEGRLRLALEASRMGTWEWDVGTGAVRWSGRVEQMFGLAAGGFSGTYEDYIQLIHAEDRPLLEEALRSALAGETTDYETRHRIVMPDGGVRWLEGHGRVERDAEGRPRRMMGTVRDITERHREEEEREALIRELEEKNVELERFTYTVSHDLKSPLVTIRGFLGYVTRHAEEGRSDELRGDVARIEAATEQMELLLDELLRLSRIGRFANPPTELDLGEAAAEAVALLRGRLEAREVDVEIAGDLPSARADRLRLVELLQNLIDNAIRFMGDEPRPAIRIGWRLDPEGPVFFVRDNGVGIDPAYHDRVFGLFDKLDPRTEGTGVGLALARRIVEVHGGRAWIESEGQGRGTAVCFTLPGPTAAAGER